MVNLETQIEHKKIMVGEVMSIMRLIERDGIEQMSVGNGEDPAKNKLKRVYAQLNQYLFDQ